MISLIKICIGYALYIGIILLGFVKKRSSRVTKLMLLYMWFLIAFNNSTADYYAYEEMYLCSFEPRYAGHEIGFMSICRLCLKLGFPYLLFRCIIGFLIVYITYKALSHYTHRVNFALALYLIFPFLGWASGLRQACSSAIIIYFVKYLIQDDKKGIFKYIIGVFLATLFHYSSLFYILFIMAKYKRLKNISMFIQSFAMLCLMVAVAKTGLVYDIVSRFTSRQKLLQWLSFSEAYISPLYIISIILLIVFLFVIYESKVIIRRRCEDGFPCDIKLDYKQVEIVSKIIIISMLAFGGAILNSVVYLRLVLTMIPVGYAVCCDGIVSYAGESLQRYKLCTQIRCGLIVLCILVTLFVYGYWIGGNTLAIPIGNYLFGS